MNKDEMKEAFKTLQDAAIQAKKYRNKDVLKSAMFNDFWNNLEAVTADLDFVRRCLDASD